MANSYIMSDSNNHINYTAADIEKYWKGQLSAAEQHNMEKAALDDPFLADAMEGYEKDALQPTPAINADNNELRTRLAKRIAEKRQAAPVIKFGWWKIAAALIVLVGAGWLFIISNNKSKNEAFVKNKDVQLQPSEPTIVKADTTNTAGIVANMDTLHDVAINKPRKTSVPANKIDNAYKNKQVETEDEVAVVPAPAVPAPEKAPESKLTQILRRTDTLSIVADKNDDVAKLEKKKSVAKAFSTDQLEQKAPVTAAEGFSANNNALARRANNFSNTFSGNIIDQANKPVANASIQIPNLNVATKTDKKGYFSFDAVDTALSVSVASVGFETQNIHLNNKDATLNQIVLTPAPANQRDVVVQSNGALAKKQPISIKILDAEPVIGWTEYNAYLDKNKKVTDDLKYIHGTVIVSFTVHAKWLNNFKIEQSLDEDLDAEAIRLIRQGPSWKLLKGKKANATVNVKF